MLTQFISADPKTFNPNGAGVLPGCVVSDLTGAASGAGVVVAVSPGVNALVLVGEGGGGVPFDPTPADAADAANAATGGVTGLGPCNDGNFWQLEDASAATPLPQAGQSFVLVYYIPPRMVVGARVWRRGGFELDFGVGLVSATDAVLINSIGFNSPLDPLAGVPGLHALAVAISAGSVPRYQLDTDPTGPHNAAPPAGGGFPAGLATDPHMIGRGSNNSANGRPSVLWLATYASILSDADLIAAASAAATGRPGAVSVPAEWEFCGALGFEGVTRRQYRPIMAGPAQRWGTVGNPGVSIL